MSAKGSSVEIPESHRDLLAGPVNVVLTTVMPDGQPQTTPVWCNLDGDEVLINTMKQFQKYKNMCLNPRVTLLAYRLDQPFRNIEVRGRVVEMSEEGALDHLNVLTAMYGSGSEFFGDSVDADLRHKFDPVKIRIRPDRVRVEG
ncbi:MAG: PPOX class F420-dependent oxidoreductase [Candidatus Promineifilaceae bacterium]